MRDWLKLIKIEGYLQNLSKYVEDAFRGVRVYKGITIVDKDGVEVFFDSLIIPVRNDEAIKNGETMTFYISRLKKSR